uniref:Uncharacterized protein n=1 Tax=Arundo donax TaxID=35708 RepID=A0A0A9GLX5_ARUDO
MYMETNHHRQQQQRYDQICATSVWHDSFISSRCAISGFTGHWLLPCQSGTNPKGRRRDAGMNPNKVPARVAAAAAAAC